MPSKPTGAMQEYATPQGASDRDAGLVLLYAENHPDLPAAWGLQQASSSVGREAPADVLVPVAAVSRLHAEITRERGAYVLRDRGSRNGTLVDGHPVKEARLEAGQELRIGDAILKFVEGELTEYARYRIDGSMTRDASRLAPPQPDLAGGYQMDQIAQELLKVGPSELSILLLGESGTGKEVAAQKLHESSGRRGDFCAVNCAAIPANLIESELFGYKRGAFSGADRDKPGIVRAAHGGTLLLDEIGDMPLAAQAKLLRVLQAREVLPIGATRPEPVNVRVICATHRDLGHMQRENTFRGDLFARLNDYQIHLPPLRERKEDIYLLLQTFLKRHGGADLVPSFRFMTALLHYDWPFNVRELEACAKRGIALADSHILDIAYLPDAIREDMDHYGKALSPHQTASDPAPGQRGGPPEEAALRDLLKRHGGNIAAVGRELGKARMQVHRWLKRYEISLEDYREETLSISTAEDN